MAGISSKAIGKLDNKKGFNGNELQNKEFVDGSGLEAYDFNARTYDQQIGRFYQIDPLADTLYQTSLTPYHFGENTPSKVSDPTGKCPCVFLIPAIVEGLTVATAGVMAYIAAKQATEQLTQQLNSNSEESSKSEESGSYTTHHQSGKRYHGKGKEPRSVQSGQEKSEEYNDPVTNIDWKWEPTNEDGLKAEAMRLRNDEGYKNPMNYNKRNSPGEKMLKKEEAQQGNIITTAVSSITAPIIGIIVGTLYSFFK